MECGFLGGRGLPSSEAGRSGQDLAGRAEAAGRAGSAREGPPCTWLPWGVRSVGVLLPSPHLLQGGPTLGQVQRWGASSVAHLFLVLCFVV